MASGGVASPSDEIWTLQYSPEEMRAAVEEATARRSYVLAHAYTAEAIERAVMSGVQLHRARQPHRRADGRA